MKKRLLGILILVHAMTFGQEITGSNPLKETLQVFPVTPEASSLGSYGNVPVNLASGKINYTVPLYTIKIGDFEWPIYLSYNYNGLITEEDHPMTGMGWDLIANGYIIRQVRGMDDDFGNQAYKDNTIVPFLKGDFNHLSLAEVDKIRYQIYDNVANRNYDSQQDKYSINVPGLDGSFVYNEKGDIVFINYKNYNIVKTANTFKITNEKGIIYHFDIFETATYDYYAFNETVSYSVPVNYLLTKVQLPNNKGNIVFEYAPTEVYTKRVVSESQTSGVAVATETKTGYTFGTLTRNRLNKIIFPNGEVRLSTTSSIDESIATLALNNISVWNNSKQIVNYDFTYDRPDKNRKTLIKIIKSNAEMTLPWYEFIYHYYPTNLPIKDNYKTQDFWGYYNGNRNSLLGGGRGIVPEKTISGALKEIKYPTEGSTKIFYEQNSLGSSIVNTSNCSYSHNKVKSGGFQATPGGDQRMIDEIIEVPKNSVISVYARVILGEGADNNHFGAEAQLQIKTDSGSCGYNKVNMDFSIFGETISCNQTRDCKDYYSEHNEKLGYTRDGKVRITGRLWAPVGTSARVRYIINYGTMNGGEISHRYVGGIRVKSTIDYDNNGNQIRKDYKYILEDGKPSGILVGSPASFEYRTTERKNNHSVKKTHRVAKSMQDFTSYQGAPILYRRVEVLENYGHNGKTVNHYSSFTNGGGGFPYVTPINNDWKKGKLLKSEVFKKGNKPNGPTYIKQKETINEYEEVFPFGRSIQSTKKAYGMAVSRIMYRYKGEGSHFVLQEDISQDYVKSFYVDYPKEYKLKKTTTHEFFNLNNSTTDTLTNEVVYAYDHPYGQLKTQTVKDSKGSTIATTYRYPYDINTSSNNALISQNRISTPLTVQSKKNGNTLFTQTTTFKRWGGEILLPEITKTIKKDLTPVSQIVYHSYDNQGYPLEVSEDSGIHILFVWGYNNTQPILKIDNSSYTGMPNTAMSLITQLKTLSDTETTVTGETNMRNLFNQLRNHSYFKNSQITGYTYNPLIGVSSQTDPKGYTTYYKYDSFNRLQYILDKNQNIIKKINYNYENQLISQHGALTIFHTRPLVPEKPIIFSTRLSGDTSKFIYTWYIDNIKEECNVNSTSFTKTFTNEGVFAITVIVYDPNTKISVTKTITVDVKYPPLLQPLLSDNHPHILKNTQTTYTVSNIGGGSGRYKYEWYLNNIKQSNNTAKYSYNFPSHGTYTVYCKVIDIKTNKSIDSNARTLHVYNPITITISSPTHIVKGTSVTFKANTYNGSGNYKYEWYLNNVKQSTTTNNFSYRHLTPGSYKIKVKTIDNLIRPTHYKWSSDRTIYVYNPMRVSATPGSGFISNTNRSVTFRPNTPTGGSGHNTRSNWKLRKISNPSWQRTLSSNGPTYTFGISENGEYEVTIDYTDTRTGQKVTLLMPVIVNRTSGGGNGGGNGGGGDGGGGNGGGDGQW
ncbi:PKD domain-containing protein [Aquimarina aquimarini]|uniref:PKD domain-containing protein n=1 Tax=Aquimarina aquimarini TaxID=1191734 RepID=UPI000D552952|nr:PKD domain-containing protein [Aquimarina aquimarini]